MRLAPSQTRFYSTNCPSGPRVVSAPDRSRPRRTLLPAARPTHQPRAELLRPPQRDTTQPVKLHLKLLGAVAFIAVQLAIPIWPTFVHPSQTRTDFSWDMFATRRDCKPCQLTEAVYGRAARKIGWGRFYRSTFHVARTRNRDRLPKVALEACRRHAAAGREAAVYVDCRCRYNNEPEVYDLDPLGGDYCTKAARDRFGD